MVADMAATVEVAMEEVAMVAPMEVDIAAIVMAMDIEIFTAIPQYRAKQSLLKIFVKAIC